MMINSRTCTLGIAPETLSALRDGMLSRSEAEALQQHITTCAACQTQLANYTEMATVLRAQHAPQRRDELWRSLTRAHTQRAYQHQRVIQRWGGVGAVGAVIIALALFIQFIPHGVSTQPGISSTHPTPTLTPTAQDATATDVSTPAAAPITTSIAATGSPVPGPQLQWQTHYLPQGYTLFNANNTAFWVAPSDPTTAYLCNGDGRGFRFFVTHDAAASWSAPSSLTSLSNLNGWCSPVVDANDANAVIIGSAALTTDGGATWHTFKSPDNAQIEQFASWRGNDYIVAYNFISNNQGAIARIYVSHDAMQTWRAIDQEITTTIFSLWVSPYDGEIIVADRQGGGDPVYWRSTDGGQHWREAVAPNTLDYAVPLAAGQWRLCADKEDLNPPASIRFVCSTDNGRTWTAYPPLVGGISLSTSAVAPDGTFYAYIVNTAYTFYRLPPGETRWQILGPDVIQSGGSQFFPSPNGGGVFWDEASNKGPQNEVATAFG